MGIRVSKVSKLDGIRSWSLQAVDTCPGAKGADGELVDACKGCYATSGNYRFRNVKAPRLENRDDWKRDAWVDEMVALLDNDRYFRWLDSGDLYDIRLARKVLEVMTRTPWVKHWLPTRMAKFGKFQPVLAAMNELPNVMVRFSSDSIMGEFGQEHGSTILPPELAVPAGVSECEAYSREGKCGGCRACWDKSVAVIGYRAHGRSMLKNIRVAVEG